MTVIGLDLGATTGYCVRDDRGVANWGTVKIGARTNESPGMRHVHLRAFLVRLLDAFPDASVVVYEQPHHRGGASTEALLGDVAVVKMVAAERGIEHSRVHTATLKKHATGSGRSGKPEMLAAAREMLDGTGLEPTARNRLDDNAADAIHVAHYAAAVLVRA